MPTQRRVEGRVLEHCQRAAAAAVQCRRASCVAQSVSQALGRRQRSFDTNDCLLNVPSRLDGKLWSAASRPPTLKTRRGFRHACIYPGRREEVSLYVALFLCR